MGQRDVFWKSSSNDPYILPWLRTPNSGELKKKKKPHTTKQEKNIIQQYQQPRVHDS